MKLPEMILFPCKTENCSSPLSPYYRMTRLGDIRMKANRVDEKSEVDTELNACITEHSHLML